MCVSQSTRWPVAATEEIPKPPLGFSSQPTMVRLPNVQSPREPVSQSLTAPQLVFVCPIAYPTERPVTDSAVTGAAFWTVRAGADAGAAATVPVPTSAAAIVEARRSRRTPASCVRFREDRMMRRFGIVGRRVEPREPGTLRPCPRKASVASRRSCASVRGGASSASPSRRHTSPRSSPTSRCSPTPSCSRRPSSSRSGSQTASRSTTCCTRHLPPSVRRASASRGSGSSTSS